MAKQLKWRRGIPDQPGQWYIWPDEGHWLNGNTEPRVCLVKSGSGLGTSIDNCSENGLFIKGYPDHEHQSEAHLFKGRVAGPIPEPIGA